MKLSIIQASYYYGHTVAAALSLYCVPYRHPQFLMEYQVSNTEFKLSLRTAILEVPPSSVQDM